MMASNTETGRAPSARLGGDAEAEEEGQVAPWSGHQGFLKSMGRPEAWGPHACAGATRRGGEAEDAAAECGGEGQGGRAGGLVLRERARVGESQPASQPASQPWQGRSFTKMPTAGRTWDM